MALKILKLNLFIIAIFGVISICLSADKNTPNKNRISVLKKGKLLYVRSYFSPQQDVLTRLSTGRNNNQINFERSWLVPAEAPMDFLLPRKGKIFHGCGDDAAPWKFNGTYIGGNHGCSDALELTIPKHGLSIADIGSAWSDAKGNRFYIIKIVDKDHFQILSENKSKSGVWKFVTKLESPLKDQKGRILKAEKTVRAQMWPACRITNQEYLVDGKTPLKDGVPTSCDFLDVIDEYDIVRPDAVLESIIKNPGKKTDYTADGLETIISNRIVYRFHPRGVCIIRHKAKINQEFELGYMGFTQSSKLLCKQSGIFNTRESYIPKTIPFEMKGDKLNFKTVQDITADQGKHRFYFDKAKMADPLDPPDRFIQFLGVKENGISKRRVGYAIGYSPLEGITKPEIRKNIPLAFRMIETRKSYPVAINGKKLPAGTELECLAYRQYFDPTVYKNPTCVYWNKQGDHWLLYADYHRPVKNDLIKTPKELVGKKISIIEKTPSLTLVPGNTVPPEGISLSVKNNYGYIVLKLD